MDTVSEILKELSSLASTKQLIAVVTAILVVILGKLAIRLLNRTVKKLKIDPTLHKFLMAVCRVVIYFVAIMIVAGSLGFEMSSLGALASVVGGLVSCPVIAVPTSVGYGASFGGVAALLAMLNSCASGVSVVNIDNGFGAGFQASLINRMEGCGR